ncbi:MAG: hypothetical protein IJZ32_01195 [Clostridia bacterium]|nr:hypothetical protein [Clostridia bacterium]
MKKLVKRLSVVFATALTLSAVAVLGAGCGEKKKKISDPQKFIDVIKDNPKANISLSADLDFTGVEWEPLEYHGTLNGNGHTISNITVTKNEGSSIGIFSYGQLSVENLKIENLSVNYFGEGQYIGGLVGYWGVQYEDDFDGNFDEYIKDVEISGTINAMGATYVGGVVGYQNCGFQSYYDWEGNSLENIVSKVEVTGGSNVGGLVGEFNWKSEGWDYNVQDTYSLVKNLKNYGAVTGIKSYVGGIVGGNAFSAKYEGCVNYGEVKAQNRVGGIAGSVANAEFRGCSNEGKVHATETAGGVIGYQSGGRIVQCSNQGEVSTRDNDCGGIIGKQEDGKEILACTNTGAVSGKDYVGGIAGTLKGANMLVSACKNEGKITGGNLVGGVVGGCVSSLGSVLSGEALIAHVADCENAGQIFGTGEWIDYICGGAVWAKGTSENNTNTGELYRNGVLIEK